MKHSYFLFVHGEREEKYFHLLSVNELLSNAHFSSVWLYVWEVRVG